MPKTGKESRRRKTNNVPVNYGVLRGKVIDAMPYRHGSDHFQIEIQDNSGVLYRIAVDVYSMIAGSKRHFSPVKSDVLDVAREVMFYMDADFTNAITATISNLQSGITAKDNLDASLQLDFVRAPLFPVEKMKVVPPKNQDGSGPDLNNNIGEWINPAIKNNDIEVFAFGSIWGPEDGKPDQYFGFEPGNGIHDIHMNQGDTGHEAQYNGVGQDGALFVHTISTDKWVAMFLRFQNQSLKTDNDGTPIN